MMIKKLYIRNIHPPEFLSILRVTARIVLGRSVCSIKIIGNDFYESYLHFGSADDGQFCVIVP